MVIRYELALSSTRVYSTVTREFYAGTVTLHALTMIFFIVMPSL